MKPLLVHLEGSDHARLRRLVAQAFTRRSVERLWPFMRSAAEELTDAAASAGQCEYRADFAEPDPARIIRELLGIPRERRAALHGAANRDPAVFGADDGVDITARRRYHRTAHTARSFRVALSPRPPRPIKELP